MSRDDSLADLARRFRTGDLNQADAATSLGIDRTTIAKVLAGTYRAGTADTIAARLLEWAAVQQAEESVATSAAHRPRPSKVHHLAGAGASAAVVADEQVPAIGTTAPWGGAYCTRGQRLMWALLEAVRGDRELGILVAPSGSGKSYVLDRWAELHPEVRVHRPLLGVTRSAQLRQICRLLGVPSSGSNDDRIDRMLDEARRRARGDAPMVLVVDEADLIVVGRYAGDVVQRLEIYRQLSEAGAAVCLVGLPALLSAVVTGGETYVFSRIGFARSIEPASTAELAAYWRARTGPWPQAQAKAALVAESAARYGLLRYCDKLTRRLASIGDDLAAAESLLFRGEQP